MKKILTLCTILALSVSIMFTALSLTGCDNGDGGGSGIDLDDTTPPTVVSVTPGLYPKQFHEINASDEPLVAIDNEEVSDTFTAAINYALEHGGSYTLVLDSDVEVTSVFDLNVPLSLTIIGLGSNRVITSHDGWESLFKVSGDTTTQLILDNNITLKGELHHYASLVTVDGGYFTMKPGSAIKDNTINGPEVKGGGVSVKKGVFMMEGGEISGNKALCNSASSDAYAGGGGVFVDEYGLFFMKGGKISNNTCENSDEATGELYGGGVLIWGYFYMYGGQISGNTADLGGGVCMDFEGEVENFIMYNGDAKISGNNAINGGGVFIWSGKFKMENGEISTNEAEDSGGGVYVYGTFTMEKGEISTNEANVNGGGVYVASYGTFTMKNGKISGNETLEAGGGGVFVDVDGTFTMEGGEISSNNATITDPVNSYGGGVYVYQGTFTLKNTAVIKNNTAVTAGGGVWVTEDATFIMEGGEISRNTAPAGGGVFVWYGTFTMQGGEISYNNATGTVDAIYGGGGVYMHRGTFTLKNTAVIKNNNAARNGGGVYINGDTFTMEGGEISSNYAIFGGGVFLMEGTFTMKGGKIYGTDAPDDKANTTRDGLGSGAAILNFGGTANYDAPLTPGTIVSSGGGFSETTIPNL
jgi:hypothetical protein